MDNEKVRVIDARNMEPPEPFVATLEALDTISGDEKLLLLLYREPQLLYNALRRNGHGFEVSYTEDGVVQILISAAA